MSSQDRSLQQVGGPSLENIEHVRNHSALFRAECLRLISETDKQCKRMHNDCNKQLGKRIRNQLVCVYCKGWCWQPYWGELLCVILLFRSAEKGHPISEEGVGAEIGGDYVGDWWTHCFAEQSGESLGGQQRATESHHSLSGRKVRLEDGGQDLEQTEGKCIVFCNFWMSETSIATHIFYMFSIWEELFYWWATPYVKFKLLTPFPLLWILPINDKTVKHFEGCDSSIALFVLWCAEWNAPPVTGCMIRCT